jgi:hypothetical protein
VPLSAISCRQAGPGDNTPRIMNDWGAETMPGPTGQHTSSCNRTRATKKVTGEPCQLKGLFESGSGSESVCFSLILSCRRAILRGTRASLLLVVRPTLP